MPRMVDKRHDTLYKNDYLRKERIKQIRKAERKCKADEEYRKWSAEQAGKHLEELEKQQKNNMKGGNNMEHKNFKSIFTALKEVYLESAERSNVIHATWEKAQEEWKCRTDVGEENYIIQKGIYLQAKKKYEADMEILKTDTAEQTKTLYAQLEAGVASYYEMKPDKVDSATLELLKLGVMKDSDLSKLAKDNEGNQTMLAVINKYASERDTPAMKALVHTLKAVTNDKKELNAFHTICEQGDRCFSPSIINRTVFARTFVSIADEAIENASGYDFIEN